MSKTLISDKLKDVEARFGKISEESTTLQNQINESNKQLSAMREEMVRIQGEYRVLTELSGKPEDKK